MLRAAEKHVIDEPSKVVSQSPIRWQERSSNERVILTEYSFRRRSHEDVKVEHTSDNPESQRWSRLRVNLWKIFLVIRYRWTLEARTTEDRPKTHLDEPKFVVWHSRQVRSHLRRPKRSIEHFGRLLLCHMSHKAFKVTYEHIGRKSALGHSRPPRHLA